MARIPDHELERLKREVSLERLVSARGIELRRHGADLIGLCPFHDDHEPSLVVTPTKNLWHCLGACQTGGSVIDWVMKTEGISFRHAAEILRADVFPLAASSRPIACKSDIPKLAAPISPEMTGDELALHVVDYYHDTLRQSPETLRYLESRGLRSAEMIERFRLGFANRTLGFRLPAKTRAEGRELRARLQSLGLMRESGHEHFNGSLVIPVFDEAGRVVEMYGRKITLNLRPGTPLHMYLAGPHRGVWNIEALQASKEIILCEALIDALTFWCAGYRNVTASYGVEGFTADHLAAFKRYGTERVLIAYDRDEAGDRAAATLAQRLISQGIDCYRIEFPKGMDANEYALRVQPAAKSLGVVIRSAAWIGNGQGAERSAPTAIVESPVALPPDHEQAAKEKIISAPADDAALPLAASPLPPAPAAGVAADAAEHEVVIHFGDRRYRVRGLKKNTSPESMRVNVLVARDELGRFFVDTLEFYSARHRAAFEKQAATEIGATEEVIKKDLAALLRKLEELQDEEIRRALEPKAKPVILEDAQVREAMQLLEDPHLVDRILADFAACGVVGEETNKLMAYLAAVSRKLDKPLAIIIQSSSAAGKTLLMDAVLSLMPGEERVRYSAVTGRSLFYMQGTDLKHKILAISEEEGAEHASYALKLLQSEGELTIASTGKDAATGKLVTEEYHVEGPVMIILTTTAIEIDEELLNRCIVLTVDEDREQTRAIHRLQREAETLEGLLTRREADHIRELHRNAQRLLRPLAVVNPFARELTFLDASTRTRRDHTKYLTLIRTIALLHQYQREKKFVVHRGERIEYIEVTLSDIALANRMASEVLGRSLDELAPQMRKLLALLDGMVGRECTRLATDRTDYRFTQREVRHFTAWSDNQVKVHLRKLVELEYLLVHRGGRGQSFVYELLYRGEGEGGSPFLMGLIDVASLTYDKMRDGQNSKRDGAGMGQGAPRVPAGRTPSIAANASPDAASGAVDAQTSGNGHQERGVKTRSYLMPAHRSDSNLLGAGSK